MDQDLTLTMKDEMEKDFADASSEESSAKSDFDSLVASKKKEINALTKAVLRIVRLQCIALDV